MFNKTAVAFLFCLTSTIANAQNKDSAFETQKPVVCDTTKKVLSVLMEKHGEMPAWAGTDSSTNTQYVLLVNPKSKTWTMVQFNPEIACVLGLGDKSILADQNKNSI